MRISIGLARGEYDLNNRPGNNEFFKGNQIIFHIFSSTKDLVINSKLNKEFHFFTQKWAEIFVALCHIKELLLISFPVCVLLVCSRENEHRVLRDGLPGEQKELRWCACERFVKMVRESHSARINNGIKVPTPAAARSASRTRGQRVSGKFSKGVQISTSSPPLTSRKRKPRRLWGHLIGCWHLTTSQENWVLISSSRRFFEQNPLTKTFGLFQTLNFGKGHL